MQFDLIYLLKLWKKTMNLYVIVAIYAKVKLSKLF